MSERMASVAQAGVGQDAECRRLARATREQRGRLDALVNSAGAPHKSTCMREDIAETVCWLIEGGKMVTGKAVFVDAGCQLASPR